MEPSTVSLAMVSTIVAYTDSRCEKKGEFGTKRPHVHIADEKVACGGRANGGVSEEVDWVVVACVDDHADDQTCRKMGLFQHPLDGGVFTGSDADDCGDWAAPAPEEHGEVGETHHPASESDHRHRRCLEGECDIVCGLAHLSKVLDGGFGTYWLRQWTHVLHDHVEERNR